ncbi:hypothetical protein A2160_00850 [Candidatus Beckwithbacteria bacterium RBG_13_42_9]|uniref:Ribonuclease J n=1 Tax=Candidatus Beckwithbacteria bacterium RBG_13_42_9 TaxID=1797457 RepID=A0A1F5E3N0_9BACT|nr:MAG: hypothetical protein A2160_00850 [Candidatus Beckwithbacteria bacterium RBG_13_42_9]
MIRIIPLGGIGHVTKNLFVYEYLRSDRVVDRIIIDCGIGFPEEEEMYGVDLLIPDITYLKGKEETIRGIVLSHGHDDHVGGLPYILPQFDRPIPIYASKLTAGFATDTLMDFSLEGKINILEDGRPIRLGNFMIETVAVTHSVPDTKHLVITTPDGVIYHGSDFKFDWTPVDGKRPDLQKIAEVGKKGVLCLLSDCLRVEKDGYSLSERRIADGLERELRQAQGKFIMTTMSSNIHRIQQMIDLACAYHRKVALIGRSVEENVRTAERLGFIKIPPNIIVNKRKANKLGDREQCLIVGGSQGQVDSTLVRVSRQEHQLVQIKPGDRVVFAADPIPGNERAVYKTVDNLAKLGAAVSYTDIADDLHVSGHASAGELRMLLTLLTPKYIMPIGGTFRHMNHYSELAVNMGWPKQSIFLLGDGDTLQLANNSQAQLGPKVTLKTIIVDGLGIGDVGKAVLSERKQMAEGGMVVVAIPVNSKDNVISAKPEIITRGFVFVRSSKELIEQASQEAALIAPAGKKLKEWQDLKEKLTTRLSEFFFEQTQRQPLILPVLVRS